MSPVYIKPETVERTKCPMRDFYQAEKRGDKYICLGNDNTCNFCGTLEDADELKREKELEKRPA